MSLPPGFWQTYDIDFQAARFDNGKRAQRAEVTVQHNGIIVIDHQPIPGPTTGAAAQEEDAPEPIRLQQHGSPVVFRNIWMVER